MKRIITYGTFDLFHQGHYNILKRAKDLGDHLIVGVTGDSYDIERGKLNVRDNLLKRIENVRNTGLADEIIVEEYMGQKIRDITKYSVDALVVGSDWFGKFDYLKKYCDVIYLERTKNISSSQIRETEKIYRIGIITEGMDDNNIVLESKYVSGLHVESVFSENKDNAKLFCKKYELNSYAKTIENFFKDIDIVYIKNSKNNPDKGYDYAKTALNNKKHIIIDYPLTVDKKKLSELYKIAKKNNVVLTENIKLAYMRAFQQLIWHLHSDIIGDIISVDCSFSYENYEDRMEEATIPFFSFIKLLGMNYEKLSSSHSNMTTDEGNIYYDRISIKYQNAVASAIFGTSKWIRNEMIIVGTKGRITVPDDWRMMGYFSAEIDGDEHIKRYSFNIDGTGFRYLLQEALIMIRDELTESVRFTSDESFSVMELLEKL